MRLGMQSCETQFYDARRKLRAIGGLLPKLLTQQMGINSMIPCTSALRGWHEKRLPTVFWATRLPSIPRSAAP